MLDTLHITRVTLHGGCLIGNQRKARAGHVLCRRPARKSNPAQISRGFRQLRLLWITNLSSCRTSSRPVTTLERERKYGQECSGGQRSIRLIPDFFPAQSELLAADKTALGQLSFGRRSGPCLPIYLVTRMRRQVWRCHSITLPLWNAPTNTISDQTTRPLCLFVCWSLKKFPDKNAFCCQHLSKASMHTWYISWRM